MQKSIITINSDTTKQDLLLFLVSFTKKDSPKVYIDIESLPVFLNSRVSFIVFNKSLRNYPKEIIWTTDYKKISNLLSEIDDLNKIPYSKFLDITKEKKKSQVGKLTYEDRHHLESKSKNMNEFLLPQIDEGINNDNVYLKDAEEISDYSQEKIELEIAKQDLQEEIIDEDHDITYYQDNGLDNPADAFGNESRKSFEGEGKLQNLDVLIEKLEKTKLDLTKKGKYPLKVSELISMKYKPTWFEKLIPLSSVSSSLLFIVFLVIISFLILLNLFPLSY